MRLKIKVFARLSFIAIICLIGLSSFGNSITVTNSSHNPSMFVYELRLIDIKLEQLGSFGISEVTSEESAMDVSFLDTHIINLNLPGISLSIDAEKNENVFRQDFNPKIMTVLGEPAFVSVSRQVINNSEIPFSLENFIFVFNPVSYNSETGFVTEIGISESGDSSMRLITSIRHREDEWLPIAVMKLKGKINRTYLFSSGTDEIQRYAVIYMRGGIISSGFSNETLEDNEVPFVWVDFEGLENLFSDESAKPVERSSFVSSDVKFGDSFTNYLIAFEGQYYFPDIVFVNSKVTLDSTYSISEIETIVGLLIYDSFALAADLEYSPALISNEQFSLGLGFEDITNPAKDVFMKAGFIPVRIYPGREQGEMLEYPLEWYLNVFTDKNNNWNFGFGLTGDPDFASFNAEVGYKFKHFEILGGIRFDFEDNSLNPYFKVAVFF